MGLRLCKKGHILPKDNFSSNPRTDLSQPDSFLALPYPWRLVPQISPPPLGERNKGRNHRRDFSARLGLRNFFSPVIYFAVD